MTEPTSTPQPKHTHYVSLENGCIHPALTSPAGYEDEHTTEWRPATQAEIQRYHAGTERTEAYVPVDLRDAAAERTEQATPSTLTLADDTDTPLGVEIVQPVPTPVPPPGQPLATTPPPPAPPVKLEG